MILNEVTRLVEFQECPKYFFRLPTTCKNSRSFRMIFNDIAKLVELQECPKYFLRLPTTCKKFYKLQKNFDYSYKACGPSRAS